MFVTSMLAALRRYRVRRRTFRELACLDDRQLSDIGLTRGQLSAFAAGGL